MLEDAKMSFQDRRAESPAQWRREGFERGIQQGIEEGIEQQRDMVRRLSAVRFGDTVAARVEALLRDADAERLADAAEWVVRSETADEILRRLRAPAADEPSDSVDPVHLIMRAAARWMDTADLARAFTPLIEKAFERVRPAGTDTPREDMLEEAEASLRELMSDWYARWQPDGLERAMERGLEQGIAQRMKQGIKQQRDMVRRQSAVRFGDAAAARIAMLLQDADAERLADAAEWVVRSKTADEILRRLEAVPVGES